MKKRNALMAAAILVLAACGNGGADDTTRTTVSTTTTSEATTTSSAPEPATETAVLEVSQSDLGAILVDGEGLTLYLFVPDGQGESVCYDECAANWPPLIEEVEAGDGIDASLLGSTERTDGTTQVTYNGWPLYYFAGDSSPGDTNGQGLNDVWYVLDSAGDAVN